jgi:hypothetical protein
MQNSQKAFMALLDVPVSTGYPAVNVVSIDHSKISAVTGMNMSHVVFTFDHDITAYTVNVLGTSWDTGMVADSGNTTVVAGTQITAIIDSTELASEGNNRVNIYGKSTSGVWTPYNS